MRNTILLALVAGCATTSPIQTYRTDPVMEWTATVVAGDTTRGGSYSDDLVSFQAFLNPENIGLRIDNRSGGVLTIDWDEAALIFPDGEASRVLHGGIQYQHADREQPAVVIPAGAHVQEALYPSALLRGTSHGTMYRSRTHLTTGEGSGGYERMQRDAEGMAEIRYVLVIPLRSGDSTREYRLVFQTTDVEISGPFDS